MRLVSTNGNSVVLRVDGYQFPATTGSGERDYDANWLMVVGDVSASDRSWSFRDPCMTTWEARELSGWLRSVADGSRLPEPVGEDNEGGALLVFTEPNVAFNLHARSDSTCTIRVFLSLEARPPDTDADIFEYFVELSVSHEQIASALAEWDTEIQQFPVRA